MKPQDLRIGNYVRITRKNAIYTGNHVLSDVIIRVDAITRRKIGFHLGNDKTQMYYCRYSEIEPVLIREVYNSLPTITELNWCDKALCEDLYYYKDIPLTDLHQLQNIHYALTGKEIEIEI